MIKWRWLLPLLALSWATPAHAAGGPDPVASVALAIAIVLLAAKLGGEVAVRSGQPSVLGELVAGVVLGNATLVTPPALR